MLQKQLISVLDQDKCITKMQQYLQKISLYFCQFTIFVQFLSVCTYLCIVSKFMHEIIIKWVVSSGPINFLIFQTGCRPDEFQCLSGNCINATLRCNRYPDCRDASDELNCPTPPPPTPSERPQHLIPPQGISCSSGLRPCNSGNQCVRYNQFCDGTIDCNDFSDETHCGKL